MKQFLIHEDNMERLEKKLTTIANKCKKYNVNFTFNNLGETFKEVENDGKKQVTKYYIIEAEGIAKVNDYEFIANVEHTENGNIINAYSHNIEVPSKYYTTNSICEHCNSKRNRKQTYIVYNSITNNFKQIGKSCLKEYTNGLSAEMVAEYISYFDELIKGEEITSSGSYTHYYNTKEMLCYALETIKHFGYCKTSDTYPTSIRMFDFYAIDNNIVNNFGTEAHMQKVRETMQSVNFNAKNPDHKEIVKNALNWIADQTEDNNYIHNLKTVCRLEYVKHRNLGILTSLVPAYNRELEKQVKQQQQASKPQSNSQHIGNIGERITLNIIEVIPVTSWETQYGTTRLYKLVDDKGNIYTWKASSLQFFDFTTNQQITQAIVTGTVKQHTEFNGELQTELTRCKVS